MAPTDSPDPQLALAGERQVNARRINLVRLCGVSLFFGLFVVLGSVLGMPGWRGHADLFGPYWLGAMTVYLVSRRFPWAASLAGLSVALVDMPMVFVIQRASFGDGDPKGTAGYSVGLFILLVVLAATSLVRWQVFLTSLVAATLEGSLQRAAGVDAGAVAATFILLGLTGATCIYATDRVRLLLAQLVKDLTRRQSIERELAAAREARQRSEKLAEIGEIAASISHDLRNPLSALVNAHYVLHKKAAAAGLLADASTARMLEVMERELHACTQIVNGLLDFARQRPPDLKAWSLAPLVRDALEIVPKREGVQVQSQVADDLPGLRIDRDQVRQVLVNLVQNAVEAVPAGGGSVHVSAEHTDEGVAVRVHDNGPGIPSDEMNHIFEPLFTTKENGTGLGLAIVSGIVRRHGGRVEVQSAPGLGTTFTVRLPTSTF